MFEKWSELLGGNASNVWQGSTAYADSLSVIQYNRGGHAVKEYKFVHAWPSTIGPIELGWDTNDAVETYDITWSYSWHETSTTIDAIYQTWQKVKEIGSLNPNSDVEATR